MALYHLDKKTAPSSVFTAADAAFTTLVPSESWTNDLLGVDTPRGVLGGMLAVLSDDNTVTIATDGTPANGATAANAIFYNDAASGAYDNAPNTASGKIATLALGNGDYIEVDVYETHTSADAEITYAVGAALCASSRGLVMLESDAANTGSTKVIGTVAKVPTTADPRLGILLDA